MLSQYKVPIIVAVVALLAVGGGYFASGMVSGSGGEAEETKVSVTPVELQGPFTINLADADSSHYAKIGIAVQVENMTEEDKHIFENGAGGGHGPGGPTGIEKVASYAKFKEEVILVTSTFTSKQLTTTEGRAALKEQLMQAFMAAQANDIKEYKKHKDDSDFHHMPTDPPYTVKEVFFTELAVQ